MKSLILYISIVALLSACIPDPVDIDIPQPPPQLVVTSQMLSNQTVLVQVSRSFGALTFSEDNGDSLSNELLDELLVDSARVVLSHAGEMDTLLNLSNGLYLSLGTTLVPGERYLLTVYDFVSGEQVMAETEVLPPVALGELSHYFERNVLQLGDSSLSDTLLALDLSFDDLPGDNYYMVNLYRISQPDSQVVTNPDELFSLNGNSNRNTYPLSDQLYRSGSIRDTLFNSSFRPGDTLGVSLSHISPLYYQYLTTRQRSSNSIFANLLGEPVNYPSNVEGGYGLFTLHLPTVQVLVLD
jgi:hypothetical protein